MKEYDDKKYNMYTDVYNDFSKTIYTYVYDIPYNQSFYLARDLNITGEGRKRVYIAIQNE